MQVINNKNSIFLSPFSNPFQTFFKAFFPYLQRLFHCILFNHPIFASSFNITYLPSAKVLHSIGTLRFIP